MILHEKHAYARYPLKTRECPTCHFKCDPNTSYGTRFKQLKVSCKDEFGENVKLHACPKCGTIGIDIYEIEYNN